jgi:hypothetical protein
VIPDTVLRLDASGDVLDFVPGEVLAAELAPIASVTGRNIKTSCHHSSCRPPRLVQAAKSTRLQRPNSRSAKGEARYRGPLPAVAAEVLLILRDFRR